MTESASLAAPGRPFLSLLRYNRRYWRRYALGVLLSVIFSGIGLAMPLVFRAVVDDLTAARMTQTRLLGYFGALVGFGLIVGVARYWQRILMIGASRLFEYDLRNDYFDRILQLSREFFQHTPTGEVMARATNDLNYVRDFMGPGVMGTVDMLRVPFTLAIMLYFSVSLTAVALLPLPVVSFLVYLFVRYMHRQTERVQEQFGVLSSRAQENIAGARVVQAYGIADREVRDFRRESEIYMRESVKLSVVMSLAWPLIGMMVGAIVLLVLWRGGDMVISGVQVLRMHFDGGRVAFDRTDFTLGDLSAFMWCLFLLAWPLADFGWVVTLYQRGAVGMNRVAEYLVKEPRIRDNEQTRTDVMEVRGAIRFENVSFAYDDRPVLHDLSFDIPSGHTVALVGPTGSGKSSIVSLLTREYDPTSGVIYVDGEDVRRIPVRVLRGGMGYVPQDTFLFSETIRTNLTFGRPDATAEEMAEAAEQAQLRETIESLPDKYDTLLGERGVNLSGGQKQRLAIARAIIRNPRILILDDALSSVDTHTEERILNGLSGFMAARTSVIISHRVSTVKHANQILVIDNGRIVERGTHDSLVTAGGLYADIHTRQLLEEELEDLE